MIREILYGLLGLVFISYGAEWYFINKDDPREPPTVRSTIPFIGHLVGIIRHGSSYWTMTGKATASEIYTLHIAKSKLYVTNTSRLLPSVQKSSKILSFRPFVQSAVKSHVNGSQQLYDFFGTAGSEKFGHAQKAALMPGPALDYQNARMAERAIVDVDEFLAKDTVWLLEWVKHVTIQATSAGIFGPNHPFLDPKVEKAFWTWNDYTPLHVAGLDVTGAGNRARNIVQDSFKALYKEIPADASQLVKGPRVALIEGGVSEEDYLKQEATLVTAAFPNTSPTLYWVIWDLFCRPELLQEVREELESEVLSGDQTTGFVLDVAALKTQCSLLLSVFQETQRMRHSHATIRAVMEDIVLDGKYFLQKGAYLMMPGKTTHMESSIWGSCAQKFDPYRFTKAKPKSNGIVKNGSANGNKAEETEEQAVPSNSFVPWGNAPHLCPARQFVTTEILIVVALLVLRTDMTPMSGKWDLDPKQLNDFGTIHNPAKDVEMVVRKRLDRVGTWGVTMGDSKTARLSLASG